MRLKSPLIVDAEPLTLLEAAQHLRLCDTQEEADALPEKDLILALITAAREAVENYTGRTVAMAEFVLVGEVLPEEVRLPKPPFVSVTKVEYWNGAEQVTLPASAYADEVGSEPSVLYISLPADMVEKRNSARITYKAGYMPQTTESGEQISTVPALLKAAMKLLVAHFDQNREAVMVGATSTIGTTLPLGVDYLLNPYRVYS